MNRLVWTLLTLATATPAFAQILVYDENSINQHALRAAERVRPGEVTRARQTDFNTLLARGGWEVVVMDFPSIRPDGGTAAFAEFVNAGGRAVLSTWFSVYDDALFNAFGAAGGEDMFFFVDPMESAGTPLADRVFEGVPMPWFDWLNAWASDGAAFRTLPGSEPLAFVAPFTNPIMIYANEGRTIAAPVLDEMDGSTEAERIWENMMNLVLEAGQDCPADIDGDGQLTIFDFLEFQNLFAAMDPRADFDGDGSLTIFDFLEFQNAFAQGCE